MKPILIFGGGDNQITLIKSSKERGYYVVVIDPDESAPGKIFSDAFELVAPKDFDSTCRIVEKYNISGIATAQMENPLLLMAEIAEKYNFIFPSVESIRKARNKFLMKNAFLSESVKCARGKLFLAGESISKDSLKDFSFPLIVKPVDSFSSRGVMKVNNFDEIFLYEQISRSFSGDNSVLVEEFICGREFSIESITNKGKTYIIQYTEKLTTDYPYTVEIGHIQPANLTELEKEIIDREVTKAIESLGLDNCAAHTELKLNDEQAVIIELGARLGGDYISSYLTLYSSGVNMDAALADVAMGEIPNLNSDRNNFSGIIYFHLHKGKKVSNIFNWEKVLNNQGIVHAGVFVKEGDTIPQLTDSAKRSGFVIGYDKTRENLEKRLNGAIEDIKSEIILHNNII